MQTFAELFAKRFVVQKKFLAYFSGMNNATLKKLSEMLGLSISTVSRALKNHPDISDKTKLRVKELAHALDYEPNANAIQLRTSKNNLFGLIVPTISNFFYDSFISAVEEECRKKNYSMLILQSSDDVASEQESIKLCRQNRVAGLFACITSGTTDIELYQKLQHADVPVVFFDKVPDAENVVKVCMADADSAMIAANTIIKKGRKKVLALFGNSNLSITKKREAAFATIMNNKTETIILHVNNTEEARLATANALQKKPDAVFCMSDEILAGAMKAVQQAGLKIPVDIAVIAISNGYIPKLYFPEITYVETSGYKLGKLAFEMMIGCMDGTNTSKEVIVESILVEGGSI